MFLRSARGDTDRKEYDRTKDRQRILDEYMIDRISFIFHLTFKAMDDTAHVKQTIEIF